MASPEKNKYFIEEKLSIINEEKINSLHSIVKKYGIVRKSIRDWANQKEELIMYKKYKYKNHNILRSNIENKKEIIKEIKEEFLNKEYDKLKYIYYEIYNKIDNDINYIYNKILSDIDNIIDDINFS